MEINDHVFWTMELRLGIVSNYIGEVCDRKPSDCLVLASFLQSERTIPYCRGKKVCFFSQSFIFLPTAGRIHLPVLDRSLVPDPLLSF